MREKIISVLRAYLASQWAARGYVSSQAEGYQLLDTLTKSRWRDILHLYRDKRKAA